MIHHNTLKIILTAMGLCLAGACAANEIITLPLDLGGETLFVRTGDDHRLAFDAGRELSDIAGVRLHVTGWYHLARNFCWDFGNYGGGVWSYVEDPGLYAGFRDADIAICVSRYDFPLLDGPKTGYDLELTFDCADQASDWAFLADGAGAVYLTGLPCETVTSYPEVCACDPSAAVLTAELIVELAPATATENSSWGAIKVLYH